MGLNEALPQDLHRGEDDNMLSNDLWAEIRVMSKLGKPIKAIARDMGASKNTFKRALRQIQYEPHQRKTKSKALLTDFMPFILERAGQLNFNATSLHRELQDLGYTGSYSMVKLAVRPLRETYRQIEAATVRFETPPGLQAQMDWGSRKVLIAGRPIRLHIFVIVMGYSRACYMGHGDRSLVPRLKTINKVIRLNRQFTSQYDTYFVYFTKFLHYYLLYQML